MQDINNPNDIYLGVMYACEVSDLAAVFPEIPDLGDLSLLT